MDTHKQFSIQDVLYPLAGYHRHQSTTAEDKPDAG